MAKKSFSGGLSSLLGDTNQEEAAEPEERTKSSKKKLLRLLKLERRERNKSYVYSE
jgi:hypothetical protein